MSFKKLSEKANKEKRVCVFLCVVSLTCEIRVCVPGLIAYACVLELKKIRKTKKHIWRYAAKNVPNFGEAVSACVSFINSVEWSPNRTLWDHCIHVFFVVYLLFFGNPCVALKSQAY